MLTTAADLVRAREAAGVSLEEIADRTKIGVRHLRGLEAGNLAHWPPGLYARAYARAYAAEVGLDPTSVVHLVVSLMTPPEPSAAESLPRVHDPSQPALARLWHAVVFRARTQQA